MTFLEAFDNKLKEVHDNPKKYDQGLSFGYPKGEKDYIFYLMCKDDKSWDKPEYWEELRTIKLIRCFRDFSQYADIETL